MKDVREWLREADPLGSEPPLPPEEIQRMRCAVLIAASEAVAPSTFRSMRWAVAFVCAVLAIIVGTQSVRLRSNRALKSTRAALVAPVELPIEAPRQLQFVTGGGTRVIWQFNPEFELEGSRR